MSDLIQVVDGKPVFRQVKTADDATKYMEELIQQVATARAQCDVHIPNDPDTSARYQRLAERNFLIRYGQALGALTTLKHCGDLLTDRAYNEFNEQIKATAKTTQAGHTVLG